MRSHAAAGACQCSRADTHRRQCLVHDRQLDLLVGALAGRAVWGVVVRLRRARVSDLTHDHQLVWVGALHLQLPLQMEAGCVFGRDATEPNLRHRVARANDGRDAKCASGGGLAPTCLPPTHLHARLPPRVRRLRDVVHDGADGRPGATERKDLPGELLIAPLWPCRLVGHWLSHPAGPHARHTVGDDGHGDRAVVTQADLAACKRVIRRAVVASDASACSGPWQ